MLRLPTDDVDSHSYWFDIISKYAIIISYAVNAAVQLEPSRLCYLVFHSSAL
jgi:hypothetical protein